MTPTPTPSTTDRTADQEDAPMTVQSHKHRSQRAADRQAADDRDDPPVPRPRRVLALVGATATAGPETDVPLDDRRCCTAGGAAW